MTTRRLNFAVLAGEMLLPLQQSSDTDVVLAQDPRRTIEPILLRMQAQGKLSIIQRLHYDVPNCFYYVIQCSEDFSELLLLDCLHDPRGIGRYHLTSTYLLQDKHEEPWGYRASERREALYFLIKRAVKGTVTSAKHAWLREAISGASPKFWDEFDEWFGDGQRALLDRFIAANACQEPIAVPPGLFRALERRFRIRHPFRYLAGMGLTMFRQLCRFVMPSGFFVVIVGPDGSGKSTISRLVLRNLERAFRRTHHFHWRPGCLPKLARASAPIEGHAAVPPKISKYRGFTSFGRFFYYWLDFVFGHWFVTYPIIARTGLVIGERYFPDVLVTPSRYGFTVPLPIMRVAAWLVPSPDLVILLKGDPEDVHLRKPELRPVEIAALNQRYEQEICRWGGHQIVATEKDAAAVAAEVANLILERRAAKTARQAGWGR